MNAKIEEYLKLNIEQIENKINSNDEALNEMWKTDPGLSWEKFQEKCKPYWDDNYCLYTAKTLLTPFDEISKEPMEDCIKEECRVKIDEFKKWCESGYVTNYDGNGVYATENEVTCLSANPRAFMEGYIRKDFDYICWYNK